MWNMEYLICLCQARDEYCAEDIQSEPHYTTPLQVSRTIHFSNSTTPQLGLLAEKPQQTSSNDQIRAGPQRPPPGYIFGSTPGVKEKVESIVEELPVSQPPSPTKRTAISAEERKVIIILIILIMRNNELPSGHFGTS